MAQGIRIRHRYKRGGIALVPINTKPLYLDSVQICPTCQITHTDSYGKPIKTVHLYLDDTGACIVSKGVYKDMKDNGHFTRSAALDPLLAIIADIVNPPSITLGGNRFEVDQRNQKTTIWKEPVIV